MSGSGTDRGTGSRVKGGAAFELHEIEGGTRIRLLIDYALTGALAQFGRSGIIKELAAGITRQFAANLRLNLDARTWRRATEATDSAASGDDRRTEPTLLDAGALLWNVFQDQPARCARIGQTPVGDETSGLDALADDPAALDESRAGIGPP